MGTYFLAVRSNSSSSSSKTRTGILWGRDVLLETWECLHLKPSADIDQLWPSHLLILADQTSEACFDAWAGADMDQLKQRVARLLGKNRWQILGHDRSHQIDQKSTQWQNLYFSCRNILCARGDLVFSDFVFFLYFPSCVFSGPFIGQVAGASFPNNNQPKCTSFTTAPRLILHFNVLNVM